MYIYIYIHNVPLPVEGRQVVPRRVAVGLRTLLLFVISYIYIVI